MVLCSLTISSLIFRLLDMEITDRGRQVLIHQTWSPAMIMDLSVSPFSDISFGFL